MSNLRMYLLRGLPGSGKTTLAKKIAERQNGIVFARDDYLTKGEKFSWSEDDSMLAHFANQTALRAAMREKKPLVVVDACNLKPFLASPYIRLAKHYGYSYTVISPATDWARNPKTCAEKNTHGVPLKDIKEMEKVLKSIPIQVFNYLMDMETPFDPVECISQAQLALESENPIRADECVLDYNDWRATGGFPPTGGEDTMTNIDRKLRTWRERHWEKVNWLS